ncbi:hypothetical protein FRC03_006955 [Tulasnella sp. 419]|nr:hypothetical protein FRC02_004186 [Tulasnella sp. 418]KAG8968555.1 hypothetical protein FRC03_006955 [Tulasnella sp. 419]
MPSRPSASSSMHSRQPLSELPLHLFVTNDIHDEPMQDAKCTPSTSKRAMSPSVLLSPPKRRILLAEGLLSPAKSPAKRLVFDSTPMETKTLMEKLNASVKKSRSTGESSSSGPAKFTPNPFASSSYSSTSELHSRSTVHSSMPPPTPSPISPSLPETPPPKHTRSSGLRPSPEIVDSPSSSRTQDSSSDTFAIPSLTSVLDRKRHRSTASSGEGSPLPSTPKRRYNTRSTTPAADLEVLHEGVEELDDKENVPPKKKKKTRETTQVLATPTTPKRRESSVTPRNKMPVASKLTPIELRRRRAVLEAEVDEPDVDLDDN